MFYKQTVLTLLAMAFLLSGSAQKVKGIVLKWKVAVEIPSFSDSVKSLGFAGPVTGVSNNVLIVAGGANFPDGMPWLGGKKKYYNDVYVFIKNRKKVIPFPKKFTLPFSVAYAASCSTPNGVMYAGGENEKGISDKVFLVQWDNETKNTFLKTLPDLPIALTNSAAVFHDDMVFLAGGETNGAVSDKMFYLDLNHLTGGWKESPSLPKPISHSVFLASINKLYMVGGRKKNTNGISDLFSSVFEFNILTHQWTEKKSLPYALSAGTGVAFKNQLYIFGGDRGETFHKTEMLIAAINEEKEETRKTELVLQKNKLQSSHPGFSKDVLMYNIKEDTWKTMGQIPFDTPVTTTAVQWHKCILVPSGEIKAGVRTPQILKTKL